MKHICFIYSGQGSQYFNMGYELYKTNGVFKEWMDKGDTLFYQYNKTSLLDFLYTPTPSTLAFDQLHYTHPAIIIIEIALSHTLISEGIKPTMFWGNSIGELPALYMAQALDFESAILLANQQANIIKDTCEKGRMLAIVDSPESYLKNYAIEGLTIAGQNFNTHFIVSGKTESIIDLQTYLQNKRIVCQMLPISYAFHSPFIDPAKNLFLEFSKNITISSPKPPYISSESTITLNQISPQHLWNSVRNPIQFQATLTNLKHEDITFIDVGPSGTMATFIKYNQPPNHHSYYETLHPMKKSLNWLDTLKEDLT